MKRQFSAALLALLSFGLPACAPIWSPPVVASFPQEATLDHKALGVLEAYAALLEEAGDLVRSPATPPAIKHGLAQAEAVASPAIDALSTALADYLRARSALDAGTTASLGGPQSIAKAAAQLEQALRNAQAPMEALALTVQTGDPS